MVLHGKPYFYLAVLRVYSCALSIFSTPMTSETESLTSTSNKHSRGEDGQQDEPPAAALVFSQQLVDTIMGNDTQLLKRGPGRPKGSRNSTTLGSLAASSGVSKPKRPVGRPKGSGPKQQAARDKSLSPAKKHRVGRPRRYPVFGNKNLAQESSVCDSSKLPHVTNNNHFIAVSSAITNGSITSRRGF